MSCVDCSRRELGAARAVTDLRQYVHRVQPKVAAGLVAREVFLAKVAELKADVARYREIADTWHAECQCAGVAT